MHYIFFNTSQVSSIFLSASLILFSTPNLSVLYLVFKTTPAVSMVLPSVTNLSYPVLLPTALSTTFFSLLKSAGPAFSLSTSNLSTSAFKLVKSDFLIN